MFHWQHFFQNKVQIHFNFSKDVFDFLKALETLLKKFISFVAFFLVIIKSKMY